MTKERSWWRLHQVRHRDAVVLALISAAFLLASEIGDSSLPGLYEAYLAPNLNKPLPILVLIIVLLVLGFTTYFGGILVLLGGIHFSFGRVKRGRFFVGLGLGVGLLGLASRLAKGLLTTAQGGQPFGDPVVALFTVSTTVTGLFGILFGLASHTLMGKYALMLKKHARRFLQRRRKSRGPAPPSKT